MCACKAASRKGTADVEEIVHIAQLSGWLKLKFGTNSCFFGLGSKSRCEHAKLLDGR